MAKTIERKCEGCGGTFHPRVADVRRGWGRFCNKRCKAIQQEKRTGQYAAMLANGRQIDDADPSWDAHKDVKL